jgi:hypothetical protein
VVGGDEEVVGWRSLVGKVSYHGKLLSVPVLVSRSYYSLPSSLMLL